MAAGRGRRLLLARERRVMSAAISSTVLPESLLTDGGDRGLDTESLLTDGGDRGLDTVHRSHC